MNNIFELFVNLIASEIVEDDKKYDFSSLSDFETLKAVVKLAKKHDVVTFVGNAISKTNIKIDANIKAYIDKKIYSAIIMTEKQKYCLNEIKKVFNKNQILFIPLKGSILRDYYSEPWQRTSCDIDILVKEEDLNNAKEILEKELKVDFSDNPSPHDISGVSTEGVSIELHFRLMEESVEGNTGIILQDVWNRIERKEDYCCYLTDEMFYFFNMAHFYKHFSNSGCGIRHFIDLYVINNKMKLNAEMFKDTLVSGGLYKFAVYSEKLCNIWFGNGKYDDLLKDFEEYILNGAIYGTKENAITVSRIDNNSKSRFIFKRIWVDYPYLCKSFKKEKIDFP